MKAKSVRFLFLVCVLISSLVYAPVTEVHALSFPAQMNKSFSPIVIEAGGVSLLSVTIFNPNSFPLTAAAWQDLLNGVQPGIFIANPVNLTNTCGGTVTAVPGATTLSLSGGSVPAQVGSTPGQCTVSVDVSSITTGNLINTIPANELSSNGNDNGTPVTITNTTPASATLHVGTVQPPTLSKSFTPGTIWVGQVSQLAIVIRNNDLNSALTQASLTDTLPTNVVLANPVSPVLTGCGGSASLTAVSGAGSVVLNNSTIAANSTCTIQVNVTSTISGIYTNTIPANALQTQQGSTNGSPATATLNVQNAGLTKAFVPPTFQAGGTSTLTITLQNPTGTPYTGVNISDTLPGTVLTVVNGSAATTCGGTVSTTLPRTVSLTGGTIPAGSVATPGTCTITVQVTAPAGATGATFTNTIPAGALTTAQPGVSNVLPATAQVSVYATGTGVTGDKRFLPSPIAPGGNSRLRIRITAPADTGLTNFSINDPLPAGVTISNSTAASTTGCGAGSVLTAVTGATSLSLTNGTVPAGTICQINVFVTSNTPNVYTNTIIPADITDNENRTTSGNITADLVVQATDPLTMSKAFAPATVIPNGISTLTISLQNTDASPLINVSLTDTLPGNTTNGVVIAPTPNASTDCSGGTVTAVAGTQTITMTGGTIPAQVGAVPGLCTVTVDVQGKGAAATRTNTIPVLNVSGTIQGTTTTVNPVAPATADLTIANLTIGVVKGFNPLTVFGGSSSTLSVQLVNPDNVSQTGIALTDTMPAGMIIANPANLSVGTCGGTLTGTSGSGSFSFSGGSLPASGTCTLTLSVTMTVNGNLTNVIPAGAVTTSSGTTNPDPAAASLTNLPGASVSKFFSPNPIAAGSFSLLTITIQNTGNIPLSGMGLSDALPGVLPAGLAVAGPPAPAPVNNCGGSLTAVAGSQTIQLANGSLAASSSCTIVVGVTGATPGDYLNTIPAGALSSNEGASNTLPASDTLHITSTGVASIGDFVWNDLNANGIQDAGEPGIPNVTVHLLDSGGNVIATTTTDASGHYSFTNLPPGTYSVEFVPPAGFTFSPANQGANDAVDSDADVVTGRTGTYVLAAGDNNTTVDAGLHQPVVQNGMTKIIADTSQSTTPGTSVTIGEIVTYQTSVSLPPGTYASAQLTDTMDKGLAFVNCLSITGGAGLATDNPGGFAAVCSTPTLDTFPSGSTDPADVDRRATFNFGTLSNTGNSAAALTVTYRAVVIDNAENVSGVSLNNSAAFAWNGGSLGPAGATVQVVEPKLSITKTSDNSFVAVGSNITFTLTLQHTADSKTDAFDVTVNDVLPIYLDIVPGTLDCTPGAQDPVSCTYNNATRTITAHWDTFTLAGGNGVIQFHAITSSLPGNGNITNVGTTDWSSLPGDFSSPQSPNTLSTERFFTPSSPINDYDANSSLPLTPLGGSPGGPGTGNGRRGSEARVNGSGVIIPVTGFAPGKFTDLSGLPVTTYDASTGLTLDIPKLHLVMPIVGVPLSKGTWDVNWLLWQAGWLQQTAFPGFKGNSVLTSHVTYATGGPGPFAGLYTLSPGDKVFVHAFGQLYIYEVRTNKTVKPDDISVFRHEDNAWLTLITCGNYDEALGVYLNRTVVRAELIQTMADPNP